MRAFGWRAGKESGVRAGQGRSRGAANPNEGIRLRAEDLGPSDDVPEDDTCTQVSREVPAGHTHCVPHCMIDVKSRI